ncbi:unnamed protein product [Staurois parvus]|uniref:Uncharacterized protein n=1 Tax=Staurois parvus TaxID=386267 RepID=A0ABN9FQM7_9NEOB|nr:unnamed protein product [Staurois parvus]
MQMSAVDLRSPHTSLIWPVTGAKTSVWSHRVWRWTAAAMGGHTATYDKNGNQQECEETSKWHMAECGDGDSSNGRPYRDP